LSGIRLLPLDIAEGHESRQLEIARESGARRRVVRLDAQNPGEENRVMRDLGERACPRHEGAEVAIAAAALPGIAVSVRRTGTLGRSTRFGNIIVRRIFLLGTFARRA
jgi:hypothetical protein